jgi:hypothetical protein
MFSNLLYPLISLSHQISLLLLQTLIGFFSLIICRACLKDTPFIEFYQFVKNYSCKNDRLDDYQTLRLIIERCQPLHSRIVSCSQILDSDGNDCK